MTNAELTNYFFSGAELTLRTAHHVNALPDGEVCITLSVRPRDPANSEQELALECTPYSMINCSDVFTHIASSAAVTHVIHGRATHLLNSMAQLSAPRRELNPFAARFPHARHWNVPSLQLALTPLEDTLWDQAADMLNTWEQARPDASIGAQILISRTAYLIWKPSVMQRVRDALEIRAVVAICKQAVCEYEALSAADSALMNAFRTRCGLGCSESIGWLAPSSDAKLLTGDKALSELLN